MGRANTSQYKCSQRLEKVTACVVVLLIFVGAMIGAIIVLPRKIAVSGATLGGSARVVIESISRRVIAGSNYDARLPMASTTKVMTAYLAAISGRLDQLVAIPRVAVGVEGSSIYLVEGEKITLRDLTYGLMLRSGNDAAVAIAVYLGGSVEGFAGLMNDAAASLGCGGTNFVNPHGLHDDNHYTTAYDLAVITAAALKSEDFRGIVSAKTHRIVSDTQPIRVIGNKNKMLSMYKDATGVKTGYTKRAGRCLVSSAMRDGVELVTVVLNVGDMWNESSKLLDKGFGECTSVELVTCGEKIAQVRVPRSTKTISVAAVDSCRRVFMKDDIMDISQEIEFDKKLRLPIAKGQIVGKIKIFNQKHLIFETNIYSIIEV